MPSTDTFLDLARRLAAAGAGAACAAEAAGLESRARLEPAAAADPLRRAARGLRIAARLLDALAPSAPGAPFRPLGLRGAIAVGHLALVEGRPAQAELLGRAAAEAAPDSAAGLRLAGQALLAQNRCDEAVEALQAAFAREPVGPGARQGRALVAEALLFAGDRAAAHALLVGLGPSEAPDDLATALLEALRAGALAGAGRARRSSRAAPGRVR